MSFALGIKNTTLDIPRIGKASLDGFQFHKHFETNWAPSIHYIYRLANRVQAPEKALLTSSTNEIDPVNLSTVYRMVLLSRSTVMSLPGDSWNTQVNEPPRREFRANMFDVANRWTATEGPDKGPILRPTGTKRSLELLKDEDSAYAGRLDNLSRLEPNWDGDGAFPISSEAIGTTAWLLSLTKRLTKEPLPRPLIAPMADGGIELDWDSESGVELMLVIPPDGSKLRFLLDTPDISGDYVEKTGYLPADASFSELLSSLL